MNSLVARFRRKWYMTQTDDTQEVQRSSPECSLIRVASSSRMIQVVAERIFCRNIFAVVGCALDHACGYVNFVREKRRLFPLIWLRRHTDVSDRLVRAIC